VLLTHGVGNAWSGQIVGRTDVNEFWVFAEDGNGNVATSTNKATGYAPLDTQKPTITKSIGSPSFTNLAGDTFVKSSTPVSVTVTDSGSGIADCLITVSGPSNFTPACSSGSNPISFTGKPDGVYVIDVEATDSAGNASEL